MSEISTNINDISSIIDKAEEAIDKLDSDYTWLMHDVDTLHYITGKEKVVSDMIDDIQNIIISLKTLVNCEDNK